MNISISITAGCVLNIPCRCTCQRLLQTACLCTGRCFTDIAYATKGIPATIYLSFEAYGASFTYCNCIVACDSRSAYIIHGFFFFPFLDFDHHPHFKMAEHLIGLIRNPQPKFETYEYAFDQYMKSIRSLHLTVLIKLLMP